MRQWEIKFDEEKKIREEELIRKFYKNTEVKTNPSEEDITNVSDEDKTNDNYEEKN